MITPIRSPWKGEMTPRERFNRQLHYLPVDRSFNMEFGYWAENYSTWNMFLNNAITTESDADKKNTEMGRKYILPYGLYRCEGYISANLARKTTGFSEEDLELLWDAILNMFEHDHAAGRGKMAVRKLVIFKHDSELGNAPAHKLFDLVTVEKKADVQVTRSFVDYSFNVDTGSLPSGVHCEVRE